VRASAAHTWFGTEKYAMPSTTSGVAFIVACRVWNDQASVSDRTLLVLICLSGLKRWPV
jgi:hypothetical protein